MASGVVGMAIALCSDERVATWISHELVATRIALQIASSVDEVVKTLTEAPPPRPQILIADFDPLHAVDVLRLHSIRDGWFGSILALGTVDGDLVKSLNIERVLPRPLSGETLRTAVTAVGLGKQTTKMTKLPRK